MTLSSQGYHYPSAVCISLTGKCQCDCLHCGVKNLHAKYLQTEYTLLTIKWVIDQLSLIGVHFIDLFGGEPTLRSDLCEIISYIKSKNMLVVLESNGINLTYKYLVDLKNSGVDILFISLDDYREAHHDLMRISGAFELATKAISMCKEPFYNLSGFFL